MNQPSLLVLAAGMGSRYGGLKQIDQFGPSGETILDYSIYDALKAGFGKVVFVIRESFKKEFEDFFEGKFGNLIEVEYVAQEIEDVPKGISFNPDRARPWGTAHAVWVAREVIKEPFAVVNADDFYGRDAFRVISNFFYEQSAIGTAEYALVGYDLDNTLSTHGTVNRGIAQVDDDDHLLGIKETLKISKKEDGFISYDGGDGRVLLDPKTQVSMNMWGFYPDYFDFCSNGFGEFLQNNGEEMSSEYFIPLLIDEMIRKGNKKVRVLNCTEEWFGVTYKEDKPFVMERINKLIERGIYPKSLWS